MRRTALDDRRSCRDGSPSGGGFGRLDGAKTQPTTTGSARAQKKEAYLSQLPRLGPRSCASGAAASALEAAVCELRSRRRKPVYQAGGGGAWQTGGGGAELGPVVCVTAGSSRGATTFSSGEKKKDLGCEKVKNMELCFMWVVERFTGSQACSMLAYSSGK